MKKLPIGIQAFSDIREGDYCYVDKTPLISRLVEEGKFYFLSRPRRFGKSLLVDTIAEAFAGNKDLFTGLYLEKNWDWNVQYPVIKIDFAEGVLASRSQLDATLLDILQSQAETHGTSLEPGDSNFVFGQLLRELHQKTGQRVVVLVDEYDKPVLDHITDSAKATELHTGLLNIYSVLKAQDAHLHFVMLTGVSKFSRGSVFSGLNHLNDISLTRRFGNLCGFTQQELETVFQEYLSGVDLQQVKEWYNGYNFLGEPVYNPYDILLYLRSKEFKSYWFETGSPDFPVKLLQEKRLFIPEMEDFIAGEEQLGSFDVDFIEPEPLLFQTGHVTILEKEFLFDQEYIYHLGFPNHEVRKSITGSILHWYAHDHRAMKNNQLALFQALRDNDFEAMKNTFHAFFASIPNDWYRNNDLAGYEGFYCSIVYCYFAALGLRVRAEDVTNHGRVDMTVLFEGRVYIIEFKVNELTEPGKALDQIKNRKYAEKFTGREIYLLGVEFSKAERNISRFEWEKWLPL